LLYNNENIVFGVNGMELLEYRLLKEEGNYEALYHYKVDEVEAATRKMCEFYIKDNLVFQLVSVAKEPQLTALYVKKCSINDSFLDEKAYQDVTLEIRKYISKNVAPLIQVIENTTHLEVLRHMQSDFIYIPLTSNKYLEHKIVSTEIDEQRNTYVYYCEPTDVVIDY